MSKRVGTSCVGLKARTSRGANPILQGVADGVIGGVSTVFAAPLRAGIGRVSLTSDLFGKTGLRGTDYYEALTDSSSREVLDGDRDAKLFFKVAAVGASVGAIAGLSRMVGPVFTAYTVGLGNLAAYAYNDLLSRERHLAGTDSGAENLERAA